MKKRMGFLVLVAITTSLFVFGSCSPFETPRYWLVVYAEPDLKSANIYIDNKLVASKVNELTDMRLTYENHEIRVTQEGYKPFIAVLKPPKRGEDSIYGLEVNFQPVDSIGTNQVFTPDTIKIGF